MSIVNAETLMTQMTENNKVSVVDLKCYNVGFIHYFVSSSRCMAYNEGCHIGGYAHLGPTSRLPKYVKKL